MTQVEAVIPPESWAMDNAVTWLKGQVEDIHSGKPFTTSDDLFAQGMDRYVHTLTTKLTFADPPSIA